MTPGRIAIRIERSVLDHPRWWLVASMALLGASVAAWRRRSRRSE
jgi:hypothetical protein